MVELVVVFITPFSQQGNGNVAMFHVKAVIVTIEVRGADSAERMIPEHAYAELISEPIGKLCADMLYARSGIMSAANPFPIRCKGELVENDKFDACANAVFKRAVAVAQSVEDKRRVRQAYVLS